MKKGGSSDELVVLALERLRLAGREAVEHRLQHLHVLAETRSGARRPRRRVAELVVALHLRAEAEVEAAARELLQVPGELRGHHRAPRKRDRDVGAELDRLRVLGGDRQRQEGIVAGLRRADAVEAERLGGARGGGDVGERRLRLALAGVLRGVGVQEPGLDLEGHGVALSCRSLAGEDVAERHRGPHRAAGAGIRAAHRRRGAVADRVEARESPRRRP